MIEILDLLSSPFLWLAAQNKILALTVISLLVCAALILCGLCLAKLRLSPLWVLAILLPFVPALLLWIMAYAKWPIEKR